MSRAATAAAPAGRFPLLALGVVAAAAIVWLVPALAAALVLDRAAVAAEPWRVVTGSLVHLSAAHLLADGVAVAVAGSLVERRSRADAAILLLGGALASGAAVLVAEPALRVVGGLSGVAHAAVAYAALAWAAASPRRRTLVPLAAVAFAAKLVVDATGGRTIATDGGTAAVAWSSHAGGVLVAWLAFAWRTLDARALRREPSRRAALAA